MEAQFAIYGITTERDKFNRIISSIETDICREIEDLCISPPSDNPYQKIKNALIARFSVSKEARMRQLLDKESLGNRTPSAHLRHLKSLVPGIDEDVLKSKWLSHLPNQMEAFLAEDEIVDLDKMATRADRLYEIFNPGTIPVVATISQPSTAVSTTDQQILNLTRQVAALTRSVRKMGSRPHASGGSSRGRSRSSSRKRLPSTSDICWYHRKFGKDARSCVTGCKFQKNSSESH